MINRVFRYDVLDEIQKRWSPRAFNIGKKVKTDDFLALIEAAGYAPSCYNEQPWRFIIGQTDEDREKIFNSLSSFNKKWAVNAPAFLVILSKKTFSYNGKENKWHLFDAGTAWGYLSLQAQKMGMITHAMGGFKEKMIRTGFEIPEEYSIIAVVAVGYYGNRDDLDPEDFENEHPSPRMKVSEIILNGRRNEI